MDTEVSENAPTPTPADAGEIPIAAQPQADANPLKWCVWSVVLVAGLVAACIGLMKLGAPGSAVSGLDIDPARKPDLDRGKMVYGFSCATCHGPAGRGMPRQGAPLHNSNFVQTSSDVQIIKMVKMGRTPEDPKSVLKLPMPAKGGYSTLTDADLQDVVAFIRTLGKPEAAPTKLTQATAH